MPTFQLAEIVFKRALSVAQLLHSGEATAGEGGSGGNHRHHHQRAIAEGLASALFGQGKAQEAQAVLRAAGLARKGMEQKVPASYVRWLNKRVAKYLDGRNDAVAAAAEAGGSGSS